MVSAIITTYKRPTEIVRRAAESVLSQSYKDIELIIVDDSPSTYELRAAVKEMAKNLVGEVKYIQHEKNMGACAARNTGLKSARGEFIAFLDDDDEWLPEKIEKQVEVMEKDEELALVYCGRYSYYTKENKEVLQKTEFHRGMVFKKLILENFIGSTSFPLIRKSVIEKLGGFDINMPASQDFEMWLRIAKNHPIDYINEPLVRYYVHEGEQITKNPQKKAEALRRLHTIHADYLKKHPKAHSVRILCMAYSYSKEDLHTARKMFWKAIRIYPFPTIDMLREFKWLYVMPLIKK